MKTIFKWLFIALLLFSYSANAIIHTQTKRPYSLPTEALKQRATLTREAHAIFGLNAPIPMLAAQIEQESDWRPGLTASDLGRGEAQFMDGTTAQVVRSFPELGPADPYNPTWAIRAQVRLNKWNYARVKGKDDCEKLSAVLKGYNAGLGYVQRAQKKSTDPTTWYTVTEDIAAGQSEKNFIYSRWYPRVIIFNRQKHYVAWGPTICDINNPPPDKYPRQ